MVGDDDLQWALHVHTRLTVLERKHAVDEVGLDESRLNEGVRLGGHCRDDERKNKNQVHDHVSSLSNYERETRMKMVSKKL